MTQFHYSLSSDETNSREVSQEYHSSIKAYGNMKLTLEKSYRNDTVSL